MDIAINGSFWVGAAIGSLLTVPLLDPQVVDQAWGWRLAFGLGGILAIGILLVRRNVPESPRWLFIHGREDEGEEIVRDIEHTVAEETGDSLPEAGDTITIRQRKTISVAEIARTVFTLYPRRTVLCFALFLGQSFLYNAFFFTYGDTLTTFFGVKQVGFFIAVFAASNFAGALLLGPLFDRIGRVQMIAGTYVLSGILLAVTGVMLGGLNAVTLTLMGAIVFFFASAGASAAYLTASEVFPMETRALCIAFFYADRHRRRRHQRAAAVRQAHRRRLGDKDITAIAIGYFIGAALMVVGGIAEIVLGVRAEGQSLERIATPLTADDDSGEAAGEDTHQPQTSGG